MYIYLFFFCSTIAFQLHRPPFPLINFVQTDAVSYNADSQTVFATRLPKGITEHTFTQRLDHDQPDYGSFEMRYWKSERHYRPGGPIFALLGGETSGENRLEFIDTGILEILSRATHGMGIIVEHRYYGKSVPVPDFRTDNLKWLTTAQALKDNVHFSRNVDLGYGNATSSYLTPWIWYGGSYAGAQAAFLKHLYPDDVYGAIASSGVVHAQVNFWEYYEPIKANLPPLCAKSLIDAVSYLDTTLMLDDPSLSHAIKTPFGLESIENDRDFMNVLSLPISLWQQQQWTEPRNDMLEFCGALTHEIRTDESDALTLKRVVHNYAGYVRENITKQCIGSIKDCFSSDSSILSDPSSRTRQYDLSQTWRLWLYQVCTEWGYFMPAPPPRISTIISRLLDLEYASSICRSAFTDAPDTIPEWPKTVKVNNYGDFGIGTGQQSDSRMMIVDGSSDPWLYATAHSPYSNTNRADTLQRPFKMIDGGFHHSDEYGALQEPSEIAKIHAQQVEIVRAWLDISA